MRKIKTFITAVILTITLTAVCGEEVRAYDQCSGTYKTYTSEMKKPIKINESKLTSLSYVKKICKITDTYKCEDFTAYELDNGKGRFVNFKGGNKICLIVKDGELYGRWAELGKAGAALTCNLHDNRCFQREHYETYGNWTYKYYYKDEDLKSWAKELQTKMNNIARAWGLTNCLIGDN